MLHISLRNKLILFLFPIFLWGFEDLYSLNNSEFEITTTKNNDYKLVIKRQQFIDYQAINGFKFFIPRFTKEFSLKILRYNSIGYINGLLSMDKNFNRTLQNISEVNLKYYLTDYQASEQRELDYLLNGYSIPYKKVTSLSIEAYNIPYSVSSKLNKEIYFKIQHLKNNKLKYILYSAYIILDKKLVDKYTKQYFPNSKNIIETFLNNINIIKPRNIPHIYHKKSKHKKTKHKKVVKKLPVYRLKLHRFLFMKDFGYIYVCKQNKIDTTKLEQSDSEISNELSNINLELYKKLDTRFLFNPKDIYSWFDNKINLVQDKINNLPLLVDVQKAKCNFNPSKIDKKCFKNNEYFHNYIYYKIKNNEPLNDDNIMAYAGFKTFNDVGKYYFEQGDLQKAEIYLNKAYILADNKVIPAHNLSVLYATHSDLYDIKKAIKYLKNSNLEIDYYNLGVLYYIGLGVKESDKKAREYFQKALNIKNAKENFETMKKYKIGLR